MGGTRKRSGSAVKMPNVYSISKLGKKSKVQPKFAKSAEIEVQPIVLVQYFKKLFQYAVERKFLTRHQAKRVCNREAMKSGFGIAWKTPKRFFEFMKTFVSIPNLTSRSWAEIFYTRLITEQTLLSTPHLQCIEKLLICFMKEHPIECYESSLQISIHELLEYLTSHKLDPDNALIGLQAQNTYRKYYLDQVNQKHSIFLYPRAIHETKDDILRKFQQWGDEDDSTMIAHVRDYIKMIHESSKMYIQKGDLVLVETALCNCPVRHLVVQKELEHFNNSDSAVVFELQELIQQTNVLLAQRNEDIRIVIGRVIELDSATERIQLCVDPIEKEMIIVDLSHVVLFTEDMKELLGSDKSMRLLIELDYDQISQTLNSATEALVHEYLRMEEIPVHLFENLAENNYSIMDIPTIQTTLNEMQKISLQGLKCFIDAKLAPLREKLAIQSECVFLFHPSRSEAVQNLSVASYREIAEKTLSNYMELCESKNEELMTEIQQYCNGSKRLVLSETLSGKIHQSLDKFLENIGYKFNVPNVPENVTILQENLLILQEVMDPESQELTEKVIAPLKNDFSKNLEAYCEKALDIIAIHLNIDKRELKILLDDDFSQEVEMALQIQKEFLQEVDSFLRTLAHDIVYVISLLNCELDVPVEHKRYQTISWREMVVNSLQKMKLKLQTTISTLPGHNDIKVLGRFRKRSSRRNSTENSSVPVLGTVKSEHLYISNPNVFAAKDLAALLPHDVKILLNKQVTTLFIDIYTEDDISKITTSQSLSALPSILEHKENSSENITIMITSCNADSILVNAEYISTDFELLSDPNPPTSQSVINGDSEMLYFVLT